MENANECHLEPNLNSETYRNLTDRSWTDRQLQVILISDDEHILLGASNLTNRYWTGSVSIYDSINIKRHEPVSTLKTETGICDAIALSDNKYVVGEDSGLIQIIEFKTSEEQSIKELVSMGYVCNHDNSVLTLSAFENKNTFVSGGMDDSIKIWDALELSISHSYTAADTDAISSVATQPKSVYVFASCSWSGNSILWDIRKAKPAMDIYVGDCGLSTLDWRPNNENIIAIGHDDGSIKIMDVRNSIKPLEDISISEVRIQRIKHNPERLNLIAICSDDTFVRIIDSEHNYSIVSSDDMHKDLVRSLAWYKNEVFSCSWDNTVQRRTLPLNE